MTHTLIDFATVQRAYRNAPTRRMAELLARAATTESFPARDAVYILANAKGVRPWISMNSNRPQLTLAAM